MNKTDYNLKDVWYHSVRNGWHDLKLTDVVRVLAPFNNILPYYEHFCILMEEKHFWEKKPFYYNAQNGVLTFKLDKNEKVDTAKIIDKILYFTINGKIYTIDNIEEFKTQGGDET